MHIKILGAHQLETRDARLTSILIDGVLAIDAGSLTASLTLEEQNALQALLLTHHHFDHTRDLMTLGLATASKTTDVYSPIEVLESLSTHLVNGGIYPKFTEGSDANPPSLRFKALRPGRRIRIAGYTVLPVPVPHGPPTVGYQVTDGRGTSMFYTGDTGAGCSSAWPSINPQALFIEATYPSRMRDSANSTGHLTPELLEAELERFREVNGYLPVVRALHLNPALEEEIRAELKEVASRLGADLEPAHEGMEVTL